MKAIMGILAALCLTPRAVQADVLSVAPSQAVVLPGDGSGLTKVAVQFSLAGLRAGDGRVIDEALLEWAPSAVPSDEYVEFAAFAVSEGWSLGSVATGGAPAVSETPAAHWDVDPTDYAANDGGLVRFDVKEVVAAWEAGRTANHGVVLVMSDLQPSSLANELAAIRLVVHYGFRK